MKIVTDSALATVGTLALLSVFLVVPAFATLQQTTSLTTQLSSGTVIAGAPFSDSATLSGGTTSPAVSGTITFYYNPGTTCPSTTAAPFQIGSPVAVSGNGIYTSATTTISTPGTYSVFARYSGDSENGGSLSPCESLTVTPSTSVPEFPASALGPLLLIALLFPALMLLTTRFRRTIKLPHQSS